MKLPEQEKSIFDLELNLNGLSELNGDDYDPMIEYDDEQIKQFLCNEKEYFYGIMLMDIEFYLWRIKELVDKNDYVSAIDKIIKFGKQIERYCNSIETLDAIIQSNSL